MIRVVTCLRLALTTALLWTLTACSDPEPQPQSTAEDVALSYVRAQADGFSEPDDVCLYVSDDFVRDLQRDSMTFGARATNPNDRCEKVFGALHRYLDQYDYNEDEEWDGVRSLSSQGDGPGRTIVTIEYTTTNPGVDSTHLSAKHLVVERGGDFLIEPLEPLPTPRPPHPAEQVVDTVIRHQENFAADPGPLCRNVTDRYWRDYRDHAADIAETPPTTTSCIPAIRLARRQLLSPSEWPLDVLSTRFSTEPLGADRAKVTAQFVLDGQSWVPQEIYTVVKTDGRWLVDQVRSDDTSRMP